MPSKREVEELGVLGTLLAIHSAAKGFHTAAREAQKASGITTHEELPQGSLSRLGAEATDLLGSGVELGDHAIGLVPGLVIRGVVGAALSAAAGVSVEVASIARAASTMHWPGPLEGMFTPPGNLGLFIVTEAVVLGATAVSIGRRLHKAWKTDFKPGLKDFARQTSDVVDSGHAVLQKASRRLPHIGK